MVSHALFRVRRRALLAGSAALVVASAAIVGGTAPASAASTDLLSLVKTTSSGSRLSLGTGTYSLRDFSSQNHGVTLGQVGLAGAGVGKSVISMVPYSSTKAGVIPTTPYASNPLYVVHSSGGTPGISGFTLTGTAQGHMYGGLMVAKATNARVSDVRIATIPGNANYPPGETFAVNDYATSGSVYTRIAIDGGGVSATDFAINSSSNLTINSSSFVGTKYSHGLTSWQAKNITLNDVTLKNNQSGGNFERTTGTITINRPVLSNNGRYDFQFMTDQTGATVKITDPVLASGQKIRIQVPATYKGVPNGQKRSNIHVYVNGVDNTSTLVQYL